MSTCVHDHYPPQNLPDFPKPPAGPSPQQQTDEWVRRLDHLSVKLKQQARDDDHEHRPKRKASVPAAPYDDADGEPETRRKKTAKPSTPHLHARDHDDRHRPKRKADAPAPAHDDADGEPETKQKKTSQPAAHTGVPGGARPERGQPVPQPTGVVDVDKPIIVKAGETFDGGGKYYRPTKALGDGSQGEHQQPVFILEPGATLKNVQYSGADGIHLIGSANLDHVVNRDIGEDAITIDGAKNRIHDAKLAGMSADDMPKGPAKVVITNSSFYNGSDKVVQDNGDAEVLMKNVYVNGAGKVFRTNGGQPITSRLTVEDSTFENVKESLFRTDSTTSSASFSGIDDGGMKADALTPDAARISGTGKVSYKPYSG
jgi:hypothetical protein